VTREGGYGDRGERRRDTERDIGVPRVQPLASSRPPFFRAMPASRASIWTSSSIASSSKRTRSPSRRRRTQPSSAWRRATPPKRALRSGAPPGWTLAVAGSEW